MSFDIAFADQMRIVLSYVKFKTRQQCLRSNEKVIADTTFGKVKGVKWQSIYGTEYYSFEGIPFAKPPKGKLRFMAPVEPEPWTGIKRCTSERPKPCQLNIILRIMQGKEDCLYLNVYTRCLNPQKPMPVFVWIYGGGFQMGEATRELYSPDYLMMENIVLITFTYRLGPLGFLSFQDKELNVPGNAGLKDQVLALKWVKNNCQYFGGNPENITVFGESAGGSSTHFMMLTEQTRGLFHKGVLMSGSAISPWTIVPQRNWGYRLAKAIGYKGANDDQAVLEYLKRCKPGALFRECENLLTIEERQERLTFSFGPTIEPYITDDCVIPKPPLEMMRNCWSNSIPMMIGGNSQEGLVMFMEVRKFPDLINKFNGYHLTPNDANLSETKRQEYASQLQKLYFGDTQPNMKALLKYTDIFTDAYFWQPIQRTLLSRLHNASAPTFLYRFDFDSKFFNMMRILSCGRKVRGTCHADDVSYIFYNAAAKKLKSSTPEYHTIRRFVSLLVQFAETGNSSLTLPDLSLPAEHDTYITMDEKEKPKQQTVWQPVSNNDAVFKCLNISDELKVIDLPQAEKLKFWANMYEDKSYLF